MQRRTYPFVSVILSPGSKIGHTPRKNPPALRRSGGNLPHQRISRLAQNACSNLPKPFAAVIDYSTRPPALQVFFGRFSKFFSEISAFCRKSPPPPRKAAKPMRFCAGAVCFVVYIMYIFLKKYKSASRYGSSRLCQPPASLTQRVVPSQATPGSAQGMTSAPVESSRPQVSPRRTAA